MQIRAGALFFGDGSLKAAGWLRGRCEPDPGGPWTVERAARGGFDDERKPGRCYEPQTQRWSGSGSTWDLAEPSCRQRR